MKRALSKLGALLVSAQISAAAVLSLSSPGYAKVAVTAKNAGIITLSCQHSSLRGIKNYYFSPTVRGDQILGRNSVHSLPDLRKRLTHPAVDVAQGFAKILRRERLTGNADNAFRVVAATSNGIWFDSQRTAYLKAYSSPRFDAHVLQDDYDHPPDVTDIHFGCSAKVVIARRKTADITIDREYPQPYLLPIWIEIDGKVTPSYDPELSAILASWLPSNAATARFLRGDGFDAYLADLVGAALTKSGKLTTPDPDLRLSACRTASGTFLKFFTTALDSRANGTWLVRVSVPGNNVAYIASFPVRDNVVRCDREAISIALRRLGDVSQLPWFQSLFGPAEESDLQPLTSADDGEDLRDLRADLAALHREDIWSEISSAVPRTLLLQSHDPSYKHLSEWLVMPDMNVILWRYTGQAPQVQFDPQHTPSCDSGMLCPFAVFDRSGRRIETMHYGAGTG